MKTHRYGGALDPCIVVAGVGVTHALFRICDTCRYKMKTDEPYNGALDPCMAMQGSRFIKRRG